MKKYEVVTSLCDVNLCRKDDFYFIKRNDGFMWDMCGKKEEVKEELTRWLKEVDQENEYMRAIEKYFIYVLEGNEPQPVF